MKSKQRNAILKEFFFYCSCLNIVRKAQETFGVSWYKYYVIWGASLSLTALKEKARQSDVVGSQKGIGQTLWGWTANYSARA